jgi:hypothetical protein
MTLNGYPGRIAGGVNIDGQIYGPVLTDGLGPGKKFSLLWESASGPADVTGWDTWWNITSELNPGDWQKEPRIENSTKATLSEPALVVEVSGQGTNNALSVMGILFTYTVALFDMVLKGQKEPLLSGPSEAYPEVIFVRSST